MVYLYFKACHQEDECAPSPPYFYELDRDDGKYVFLNATILSAAYAIPLSPNVQGMEILPNDNLAYVFRELYREAKEQKRGLWKKEPQEEFIFCTMEVKVCPDGSYVSRMPPDCEFEKCLNKGELEKSQEGDPCLQDKDCKMIDCTEAIKNNQGCDFNERICWDKKCTCQFICI